MFSYSTDCLCSAVVDGSMALVVVLMQPIWGNNTCSSHATLIWCTWQMQNRHHQQQQLQRTQKKNKKKEYVYRSIVAVTRPDIEEDSDWVKLFQLSNKLAVVLLVMLQLLAHILRATLVQLCRSTTLHICRL